MTAKFTTLLSCLLVFCLQAICHGEETSPAAIVARMQSMTREFGAGVFLRSIQQAEIEKTTNFSSRNSYTPYIQIHKLYYRFYDFDDTVSMSEDSAYFYKIGKVFVSERYRELDFKALHKTKADFQKDIDGFFYYCKLYFHVEDKQFKLVIYPGYVQNVCEPYMHFNKVACPEHDHTTIDDASVMHENSIRALIRIPDALSREFVVDNSLRARDRFEKTKDTIIRLKRETKEPYNTNYRYWDNKAPFWDVQWFDWVHSSIINLFILKNSTLEVSLNLSKQMKVFRVDEVSNRISGLSLTESKNVNNEDFAYGTTYSLNYLALDSLRESLNDMFIESEDKVILNLVTSNRPDDSYLTGKSWVYRRFPGIRTGNSIIDTCIKSPDYKACIVAVKERLKFQEDAIASRVKDLTSNIAIDTVKLGTFKKTITDMEGLMGSTDAQNAEKRLKRVQLSAVINETTNNAFTPALQHDKQAIRDVIEKVSPDIADLEKLKNSLTALTRADSLPAVLKQIDRVDKGYELNFIHSLKSYRDLKEDIRDLLPQNYVDLQFDGLGFNRSSGDGSEVISADELVFASKKLSARIGEFADSFNKIKSNLNDYLKNLEEEESNNSANVSRQTALKRERAAYDELQGKISQQQSRLKESADSLAIIRNGNVLSSVAQNFHDLFIKDNISERKYFIYLKNEWIRNSLDTVRVASRRDDQENIKQFLRLFSIPLYVRAGLPVSAQSFLSTSKQANLSVFLKHQVMEIYDPFNINRKRVRARFKNEMSKEMLHHFAGWKPRYKKMMYDLLAKQTIADSIANFDPFRGTFTTSVSANENRIWKVSYGSQDHYWLQISNELFENIRYFNWFYNMSYKRTAKARERFLSAYKP